MKLFRSLETLPAEIRHGAVSIGNFDGVHRGHAVLLERLVSRARELAGPAVVFTFDPHPSCVLRPEAAPPPLTSTERKAELLGRLGVDFVVAYPTTAEFLQLTAPEYFQRVVCEVLSARYLVEGPNFFFGHERQGTVAVLSELCRAAGIGCEIVTPATDDGVFVSSSRVRSLIVAGELGAARRMLTQPYQLAGRVVAGAARGRTLGFPTANLATLATLIPAPGVYAGRVKLEQQTYRAAVHVGPIPTFGDLQSRVEVHVLNWSGDLYGSDLAVDFWERIRDIRSFNGAAELQEQLRIDVQAVRAMDMDETEV